MELSEVFRYCVQKNWVFYYRFKLPQTPALLSTVYVKIMHAPSGSKPYTLFGNSKQMQCVSKILPFVKDFMYIWFIT